MMEHSSGNKSRFSTWQRLQILFVTSVGWALVWLINATLRFRVEGWDNYQELKADGRPVILSFWHNQIFMATYFWRFRSIVVITSRHFDGEYIARIIRFFGYGSARGSSSRGAVRAMLELRKHLERGLDVAFTIDGPRGPVYKIKPGPIWLSSRTGLPILPFHIQPEKYWELNNWDRFRIPKPFTRVIVKIGTPFTVPMDSDAKIWQRRYQEEMDRIQAYCESELSDFRRG
ncbi:MAG: lysophospholipid acyltransferase family protein [Acidobacteriota bacterium]